VKSSEAASSADHTRRSSERDGAYRGLGAVHVSPAVGPRVPPSVAQAPASQWFLRHCQLHREYSHRRLRGTLHCQTKFSYTSHNRASLSLGKGLMLAETVADTDGQTLGIVKYKMRMRVRMLRAIVA